MLNCKKKLFWPRLYSLVAERRSCKAKVMGSIPIRAFFFLFVEERKMLLTLKQYCFYVELGVVLLVAVPMPKYGCRSCLRTLNGSVTLLAVSHS